MELLFKREQGMGSMGRVNFRLWGKLEPTQDEKALIGRYRFDETVLISEDDFLVRRRALIIGGIVFLLAAWILNNFLSLSITRSLLAGLLIGGAVGYWYVNEKRETIFIKDLIHGRHFKCSTVVELAKKEAYLENACSIYRQVLESAKHWDGVERHPIEPLPKDEAKDLIVKVF